MGALNKAAKFWDKMSERYSKQAVADEESYQKKLEITRKYFRPEMEVMEFGCGTGSTAIVHAPFVKHYIASDFSPNMIEKGRRKAALESIDNISFQCSTLEGIGVADESLDVILGMSILHLLENKEQAIDSVCKMLKPGGVFISSTACIGDMGVLFKMMMGLMKLGTMPLVKSFTSEQLVESLIAAGFRIDYQWTPGKNKGVFIVAKKEEPI